MHAHRCIISKMPASRTFTVVFWNILFDDRKGSLVPPQAERHETIAGTLLGLDKKLDLVCLCEAEDSVTHGHLGEKIAKLTKNKPGHWTHYARDFEHIGMFGKEAKNVDFQTLGRKATAAITNIGPVTIAGVHLTHKWHSTAAQTREIKAVLETLAKNDRAVIMGDFNSMSMQNPRRTIESRGYQSVFKLLGQEQPVTAPIEAYRPLVLPLWQRIALGLTKGFAADDIYVKGDIKIIGAGTFQGESDHLGIWATLEV